MTTTSEESGGSEREKGLIGAKEERVGNLRRTFRLKTEGKTRDLNESSCSFWDCPRYHDLISDRSSSRTWGLQRYRNSDGPGSNCPFRGYRYLHGTPTDRRGTGYRHRSYTSSISPARPKTRQGKEKTSSRRHCRPEEEGSNGPRAGSTVCGGGTQCYRGRTSGTDTWTGTSRSEGRS